MIVTIGKASKACDVGKDGNHIQVKHVKMVTIGKARASYYCKDGNKASKACKHRQRQ